MTDKKLTLIEHLEELRKRIIIIALAIVVASSISYIYIDEITEMLIKPAKGMNFVYLTPPELFLTYIKIAFSMGIITAMPIILYQIWVFVKPGLKKKERSYIFLSFIMAFGFFVLGTVFSYLVIIPLTIEFFTKMARTDILPVFSIKSYISFCSSIILSFGLTFQMPLLIILLTQLNLVTPMMLKKARKYLVLVIFIVAAVLTPPDIISQVLMAVPLWLLLELSIALSSLLYRSKIRGKSL